MTWQVCVLVAQTPRFQVRRIPTAIHQFPRAECEDLPNEVIDRVMCCSGPAKRKNITSSHLDRVWYFRVALEVGVLRERGGRSDVVRVIVFSEQLGLGEVGH
jgi:hypothetical protein